MILKVIGSFFILLIFGSLIALGTIGIPVTPVPVKKEISLK